MDAQLMAASSEAAEWSQELLETIEYRDWVEVMAGDGSWHYCQKLEQAEALYDLAQSEDRKARAYLGQVVRMVGQEGN